MSLELIVVLLIAPLVGFLINGLFGKWLKGNEKLSGWIGSVAVLISLICSIIAFASLQGGGTPFDETLYEWITGESFAFNIGFRVDALTTVMLLVITGVGFLIHVYSIGYMHGDAGYTRYFAYLNLFVFAMLILVLGNNYLMMFVGWEGVGSVFLPTDWVLVRQEVSDGCRKKSVHCEQDWRFRLPAGDVYPICSVWHP